VILAALAVAASSSAASGGAVVEVAKTAKLGRILVDAKGRTLYMWRADRGTASVCYGQCVTFWPPLLTRGKPVAAAGARASLLGTTTRRDGRLQVTYGGHPLYLYAGDSKPGQTNGEGSNGGGATWWVLAPSGAVVVR
ncbi:MAG TPA: hypothetical protein VFL66_08840, partial [Gaiellaceae bacterium]|nr:hypothetical protein [Gaiellaceae bacterium]